VRRTLTLAALIVATALCADCRRPGRASATPQSSANPGASAGQPPGLPPCAHAGPPVSLPPDFPKNFPLPQGTVITVTRRAEPALIVQGFIPMELKEATRFFVQRLPAAGFQLGRGEAERAEAEARFGGSGVIGLFKLRSIEDCPRALELTIRVQTIEPVR
jgi:hypothetical protein